VSRGRVAKLRTVLTDPILEFVETSDVIDLTWGHPGPDLLPVAEMRTAANQALDMYGPDALNYGASVGPAPILQWLRTHIGTIDSRAPADGELLITAGASQGLDLVCTMLTEPADTILVPAPTYHLALKIMRDHPLRIVPIETDAHGARTDAMADAILRLRRRGERPRAVYIIPTFGNPTSLSLIEQRRRDLVELAAGSDMLIIEDDVYRELVYDDVAPPSIWSMADAGSVIRLGSFSKTLSPGLRLGFLTANASIVDRLASGGLLDSGGGVNHFAALVAARFADQGGYLRHVTWLRAQLATRRDALVAGLLGGLPDAVFDRPSGGYFLWLRLPPGLTAQKLRPLAVTRGVDYLPGEVFGIDEIVEDDTLRLSFSLYPPERLAEGARRLSQTISDSIS
jgi:2-aminoadipate transaminase